MSYFDLRQQTMSDYNLTEYDYLNLIGMGYHSNFEEKKYCSFSDRINKYLPDKEKLSENRRLRKSIEVRNLYLIFSIIINIILFAMMVI